MIVFPFLFFSSLGRVGEREKEECLGGNLIRLERPSL